MAKILKTCSVCTTQFYRYVSGKNADNPNCGKFCSIKCFSEARWHNRGTGRKLTTVSKNHPLIGNGKRPRIFTYRAVLYDSIGPGPHPCYWCSTEVNWESPRQGRGCFAGSLVVDHLDGNKRNDRRENLVASCNRCNTLRGLLFAWKLATKKEITILMQGLLNQL